MGSFGHLTFNGLKSFFMVLLALVPIPWSYHWGQAQLEHPSNQKKCPAVKKKTFVPHFKSCRLCYESKRSVKTSGQRWLPGERSKRRQGVKKSQNTNVFLKYQTTDQMFWRKLMEDSTLNSTRKFWIIMLSNILRSTRKSMAIFLFTLPWQSSSSSMDYSI
jgi:hypothetical protein